MMRNSDIPGGRIAVAMSGGVDSAVTAALLKQSGADVVGFFLRNGVKAEGPGSARSCCSVSDAADARRVAAQLGIPFYALDVSESFRSIVDDFVAAYRDGRTPNPCVQCNVDVKFGRLAEVARSIGAQRVATGHYARLRKVGDRVVLRRARDLDKDQSYVLSTLAQEQLAYALFPLGDLEKADVRAIAREAGLPVADKPESMEICFVPTGNYRDLVAEHAPDASDAPDAMNSGEIVTVDGQVIGRHDGVAGFTIGQRRGLGVAVGARKHVVHIDRAARRVVIGTRDDASSRGFSVADVNWVLAPETGEEESFEVTARIRHRHRGAPARAWRRGASRLDVEFEDPEFAVTPGQTAVLYVGDDVLAAGVIDNVTREGVSCETHDGTSASP